MGGGEVIRGLLELASSMPMPPQPGVRTDPGMIKPRDNKLELCWLAGNHGAVSRPVVINKSPAPGSTCVYGVINT
jgi:hypothetical protein